MTGQQQPVACTVDASLLAEGQEAVQKSVLEAMQSANEVTMKAMAQKMSELYSSMGLPIPPQQ